MSSTDEEKIRDFYRDHLVPAAARLRARGVEFFPLGPDPDEMTWYVPGPDEPEFTEIESDTCEEQLREAWRAEGLSELEALAHSLMELARELELDEEQSAELSPFIYVMY